MLPEIKKKQTLNKEPDTIQYQALCNSLTRILFRSAKSNFIVQYSE